MKQDMGQNWRDSMFRVNYVRLFKNVAELNAKAGWARKMGYTGYESYYRGESAKQGRALDAMRAQIVEGLKPRTSWIDVATRKRYVAPAPSPSRGRVATPILVRGSNSVSPSFPGVTPLPSIRYEARAAQSGRYYYGLKRR